MNIAQVAHAQQDMEGPILEHYQEKGETDNGVRYSTMLEEKLKPAIHSHCGLLSKGVLLLRDNARPHSAAATVTTIQKLKIETINYPPCSPDLDPSNYHVFGMLKEALQGRRFHNDDEVKQAVHFWLRQQAKTFFSAGIQKPVKRCEKCIAKDGDYAVI
jgi:histone-lysine N-methyltransferase SETMAR